MVKQYILNRLNNIKNSLQYNDIIKNFIMHMEKQPEKIKKTY